MFPNVYTCQAAFALIRAWMAWILASDLAGELMQKFVLETSCQRA
jgi:hypothetical protein